METEKKKKPILPIIITAIVILLTAATTLCLRSALSVRTYTDLEEFQKHSKNALYYDIPATATDCRYAIREPILSRQYLYAFTLEEAEYREYIDKLIEQYDLIPSDGQEKNYPYAHYYGMKVADCHSDYQLDDFPVQLPFEAVSDKPIEEYTIIVYYPVNTGSKGHALVTIPEERRIVCYQFYAAR